VCVQPARVCRLSSVAAAVTSATVVVVVVFVVVVVIAAARNRRRCCRRRRRRQRRWRRRRRRYRRRYRCCCYRRRRRRRRRHRNRRRRRRRRRHRRRRRRHRWLLLVVVVFVSVAVLSWRVFLRLQAHARSVRLLVGRVELEGSPLRRVVLVGRVQQLLQEGRWWRQRRRGGGGTATDCSASPLTNEAQNRVCKHTSTRKYMSTCADGSRRSSPSSLAHLDGQQHGLEVERGRPTALGRADQQVEAHRAGRVDVGVEDDRVELAVRRLCWVVIGERQAKLVVMMISKWGR
jgi:hypothetical protein